MFTTQKHPTMKTTFITLAFAAIAANAANAASYDYLTFQNLDGSQTSMAVDNLKMTVNDGKLVVTNAAGSATLPLSSLSKMFFAETSGISDNLASDNQSAKAYTLAGVCVGTFRNVETAKLSLTKGIYVIKTENKTQKVMVK